ncbi:MAG: ABC transporter substrate-binding protein, partial [Actinomycetota bacterium]|nr:ABC transporter substrate-binding protein [Actinomycetota bacterium]
GSTGAPSGPNQASDVGVTATTIRIGTIVAENGVLGDTFAPAATGLRAWVEWINAQGGISGRTVQLSTCDDREDRARTLECARRLVEQDKVFALVATNSRALGGAATYLNEQGVPVLGFPINNAFYRFDNFFTIYGTPFARDNRVVGRNGELVTYSTQFRWFKQNLGATKAAVFSYDIAESNQAGAFIAKGLEVEGFQVTRYVVSFAAPAFDAPVADMQRNGTELVYDSMDPGANRRLCDAMARRGFTVKAKISTVVGLGDAAADQLNDACRPVAYIPTDSRVYTDERVPYVKAYNDAMDRYQRGKPHHQWGLETWEIGEILRQALVGMGPAPTREGFVAFLRSKRDWDVNGVMTPTLTWAHDPDGLSTSTIRDCIGISRWSDDAGGWIEATPFPFCLDDAKQFFTPAAEQGT